MPNDKDAAGPPEKLVSLHDLVTGFSLNDAVVALMKDHPEIVQGLLPLGRVTDIKVPLRSAIGPSSFTSTPTRAESTPPSVPKKKNHGGRPRTLPEYDGAKVRELRGDTKASVFCLRAKITANTLRKLEGTGTAELGTIKAVCCQLSKICGSKITPTHLKNSSKKQAHETSRK
jgi:hypothetical protein